MAGLEHIEHFVVLMLENRSFDCMLGALYPKSDGFDGLSGNETNLDPHGRAIQVWSSAGTDESTMSIPDPDPGELWTDINFQLFGSDTVPSPAPVATMEGFVRNYLNQKNGAIGKNIMHYFTPAQVPVISALAKHFAVCDRWFASAPCQTWPNRWFVHTGTADGRENNNPPHLPDVETIYNRLEQAAINWKIYFHDLAQSHTLLQLLLLSDHFHFYSQFRADCQSGDLPAYSFIEPRYYAEFGHSENDQHPPSVVTLGEQLIADVYNCIRSSKLWRKTMLVITYDEHGGCYDHVPPPAAVEPEPPRRDQAFSFDRYGVRVPAIIVSPYVKPGTILRSRSTVPYDHTSVIATLRKRFPAVGGPLTERDATAPDLEGVLELATPENNGPRRSLVALPYAQTPSAAAEAYAKPLNDNQRALVGLAANLPEAPAASLHAHLERMKTQVKQPSPDLLTDVRTASNYVKQQVSNLFSSV